ncbi:hypothetical protein [Halomonas sp. M20]|uniref:pilus assembly PilX family protein n=1 Tax=Halomonas sp. M20 TaxID=2763264 RepID=UPI001D09A947|nr:hypothetical protein [Halomonas sp. M20]
MVLVMLAAVGLLAVIGAEDSQLQAKMSLNSRHYEQAYNNAESTLVIAEKTLLDNLKDGTWQVESSFDKDTGIKGLLNNTDDLAPFDAADRDAMMVNGIEIKEKGIAIGVYVIEYLGKLDEMPMSSSGDAPVNQANAENAFDNPLKEAFRVSALGSAGASGSSWAVVQSEMSLDPSYYKE